MTFEEKWISLVLVILFGDIVEITAVTHSTSPSASSSTGSTPSAHISTLSSSATSSRSPLSISAASTPTWSIPTSDSTTVLDITSVDLTTSLSTPGSSISTPAPSTSEATSTVITTPTDLTSAVTHSTGPSTSSSTRSTPSSNISTLSSSAASTGSPPSTSVVSTPPTSATSTPTWSIPTSDSTTVLANTTVGLTTSLSSPGSSISTTSATTTTRPIEATSTVLSTTFVNTIGTNTTTASVVTTVTAILTTNETTTPNATTIKSSSTSTTKLSSTTNAKTTTTTTDVPTTKYVEKTTSTVPTTTYVETTTIAVPTTTDVETTTIAVPTTIDVETTTIAVPATTDVQTTTPNATTIKSSSTSTTKLSSTTNAKTTTTTIEVPTTTDVETTTTTNGPTTTDVETTTIENGTITTTRNMTTRPTTVTVTPASSKNTSSSTTPTIYTTQVVLTTPEYECSTETIKAPEHGSVDVTGISLGSIVIYTCNIGYTLHGTNYSECILNGSDAIWSTPVPTCHPRDCGPWNASINNYVPHSNTTYGSTAVSICYPGYAINGGNKTSIAAICSANGTWTIPTTTATTPPPCTIIVCDHLDWNETDSMNVTYTHWTNANSTATFSCPEGFSVNGYKSITCDRSGQWSGVPPSCKPVAANIPHCPDDTDSYGRLWNKTAPGEIATSECGGGYTGKISRRCNNGRWLLPVYDCISNAIAEVDSKIDALVAQENVKESDVLDALNALSSATTTTDNNTVYGGEITKVTSILDTIVSITEKVNVTKAQAESFADIASNLLSTKNTESWNSISQNQEDEENKGDTGAPKILNVVSKYSDAIIKSLNSEEKNITVTTDNLVLQASKIDANQNVTFPADNQNLNISCAFTLSKEAVKGIKNYSAIVYKDISGIMSSKLSSESTESTTHTINSAVISVKMANLGKNFSIDISLGHLDKASYTEPKCTFWNESLNAWSGQGCIRVSDINNETVCRCNHLTNFAILMSPWTEANVDTKAIDIISIIGCSVSMVGLLVTVITHIVLWRYLKSDRVVLLMNLSVALILSYAIFVGGVDKTDNKDACTVVAVLLHYIYLVVFCLMLAEGVEIAVQVLYVFTTKSRLKWILPCAWLLPAVIVAISMGLTQLEGYGNKQSCWLSVDQGLIWAFVAPALTVILVNFVLLGLAIKAMFGTASLAQKSRAERVRTGVRCLCILVPLMGCTWVIGVFYVNESVAWIQYIFAVCNSLQGLVIFLFHCVLNKQIRIAIQKRRRLYYKTSMETKQTSRTFSMPRVSLSNNSLQSMDNSYGSSPGFGRVSAESERYELIQNPIHRRNNHEYAYINPTRI